MGNWQRLIGSALNGKTLLSEPLSKHTTFRIGGPAQAFVTVDTRPELLKVLEFVRSNAVPWKVVGGGSNLLVSGQGFPGLVVKLGAGFATVEFKGSLVRVGAGMPLAQLVDAATSHSLTGVEFFWGIPGAFGGSIRTNAGAFGQDVGKLLTEVEGIGLDGRDVKLARKDLKFSYRDAVLPDDIIITGGTLELEPAQKEKITAQVEANRKRRNETQPKGPSAGCIFKNPRNESAGRLIEAAGMKGKHIGDAVVSERHANFIINRGMALFGDVYQLIELIKLKVEEKFGVVLEEEVEIVADGLPLKANRLQAATVGAGR